MTELSLADIALILGIKKPTASLLKNGKYHEVAEKSDLPDRYKRLAELTGQAHPADPASLCETCPRQDCTGCRVAELI